jgi:SAM-dependent methyltransferase
MLRFRFAIGLLILWASFTASCTLDGPHTALAQATHEPDVIYEPTPSNVVAEMLKVANVTRDDVVYDLGSGDGRIVIAAAQAYGARGVGVDIDPDLVRQARENAREAGVADRVKFIQADLFETDLSQATVVTLYLLPGLNLRLRPKLLQLKPARVSSHTIFIWAIGNRNGRSNLAGTPSFTGSFLRPAPASSDPDASESGQRRLQHSRDVQRLAARPVFNLMAAARAVGDDESVCRRLAHFGEQRKLRHSH